MLIQQLQASQYIDQVFVEKEITLNKVLVTIRKQTSLWSRTTRKFDPTTVEQLDKQCYQLYQCVNLKHFRFHWLIHNDNHCAQENQYNTEKNESAMLFIQCSLLNSYKFNNFSVHAHKKEFLADTLLALYIYMIKFLFIWNLWNWQS
jgi:hypothetical protein